MTQNSDYFPYLVVGDLLPNNDLVIDLGSPELKKTTGKKCELTVKQIDGDYLRDKRRELVKLGVSKDELDDLDRALFGENRHWKMLFTLQWGLETKPELVDNYFGMALGADSVEPYPGCHAQDAFLIRANEEWIASWLCTRCPYNTLLARKRMTKGCAGALMQVGITPDGVMLLKRAILSGRDN